MNMRAAAVQMNSGGEVVANLKRAGALVDRAAGGGAQLAVLPENFSLMQESRADLLAAAEEVGGGAASGGGMRHLINRRRRQRLGFFDQQIQNRFCIPQRLLVSIAMRFGKGTELRQGSDIALVSVGPLDEYAVMGFHLFTDIARR